MVVSRLPLVPTPLRHKEATESKKLSWFTKVVYGMHRGSRSLPACYFGKNTRHVFKNWKREGKERKGKARNETGGKEARKRKAQERKVQERKGTGKGQLLVSSPVRTEKDKTPLRKFHDALRRRLWEE